MSSIRHCGMCGVDSGRLLSFNDIWSGIHESPYEWICDRCYSYYLSVKIDKELPKKFDKSCSECFTTLHPDARNVGNLCEACVNDAERRLQEKIELCMDDDSIYGGLRSCVTNDSRRECIRRILKIGEK